MWSGPLHNAEFVGRVLEHVDGNLDKYGTSTRMKGMLTVAKEVRSHCGFLMRFADLFLLLCRSSERHFISPQQKWQVPSTAQHHHWRTSRELKLRKNN